MTRYEVVVSRRAENMLEIHACFLARVSIKAARSLTRQYGEILSALEENPYQFPIDETVAMPTEEYRKALFGKWYKAVFHIENDVVYLEAVVDCRMDTGGYDLSPDESKQ